MNNKTRLNLSAFTLGLTSMVSQIIIIRELIIVCYGNELSLGSILASWLFWVAFGSFIAGKITDKLKSKTTMLASLQFITALVLPLNIILIRNIKSILKTPTGQIIDFIPMMGSSFVSLCFICSILGFTFVLISKLSSEKGGVPFLEIGKVYLIEGLGASVGGTIYSFFLIKTFSPFENIFILAGANIITSALFYKHIFTLIYMVGLITAFIFKWPLSLENLTRQEQFKPFKLVESTDSIYGNVSIIKAGEEYSLYENGLLVFTSGDLLTSEESVQYALLEHPRPQRILLIGGGFSGSLEQILKHPVTSVDYVELDPTIIKLAEKYLAHTKDRRIQVFNIDGRLLVKQALQKNDLYDVIILNIPDPYTAMINRFYSLEFFGEVKQIIKSDGIFSFSLASSENYLNLEQTFYLASIYKTLKKEFSDIKVLPGDTATFLASKKQGLLTYDADVLIKRLKEREINTKFVREYYLPFKLNPFRVRYLEDAIKEASPSAKINKDFRPIGYFYNMSLWMSLFHSGRGVLPYLEKINLRSIILIIIIIFSLLFLIQCLRRRRPSIPVILSIGTTGMSEISFQIIVILAFQFLYGYVYYKIGMILTAFMAGLVLGSFCINRILKNIKNELSLFIKTQVLICLYPLLLPLIFIYISKFNLGGSGSGEGLQASFAILPIIAGFVGGFQFPLANKICLGSNSNVSKISGMLYGIDILGASLGALLVGTFLIPILGILQTCVMLFIINTLVLILLLHVRSGLK